MLRKNLTSAILITCIQITACSYLNNQNDSSGLTEQAIQLIKSNTDSSITLLKEALSLDNQNAKAHKYLGLALLRKKKFEESIISFKKHVSCQPKSPMITQEIGVVYQYLNKGDSATKYFDLAQSFFEEQIQTLKGQESDQAKINLALNHFYRGSKSKAIRVIETLEYQPAIEQWKGLFQEKDGKEYMNQMIENIDAL